MIASRWTVPLACITVALTMIPATAPAVSTTGTPPSPAGRESASGGASYQLTLITGDRVRVTHPARPP